MKLTNVFKLFLLSILIIGFLNACGPSGKKKAAISGDAASQVYVAPGEHDEFYAFLSGGYSGQVSVYGLPSGRLFRVIPVFTVDGEKAYGFNEETKPMLETSFGFVPWDDSHHPELSQTNGQPDGKWLFINANNTPRIARIDLTTYETVEIIELPNSAGNHASPFTTPNSEYVVAGTRFSLPIPNEDVSIESYKEKFKGTLSFVKIDKETGDMSIAFQILMPGFNYDLSHSGKGHSDGWMFFTSYNTEQSHTLLEVNASQKDKDFIAAINWKKAEQYAAEGKTHDYPAVYFNNEYDEATHTAKANKIETVKVLLPEECPDMVYFLPTPKSPHGVDIDPTGEYIVGSGKLSADMSVHSFTKMIKAIENKDFAGETYGIPILKYESILAGVVPMAARNALGPLHTEFDGKGNAYTSFFISSEIVKWEVATQKILDRVSTYYSVGHLMIPGGDSEKPWGKYMLAMNKMTKDRFLPTGPELPHAGQLFDISGDKMKLILDFPMIGEPHYAQAIPAELLKSKSKKIYKLVDNKHPYAIMSEKEAKIVRKGNNIHVYMSAIRSNFVPDNIEGIKVGDKVFFHVTNIEQDWDIPHGFAIKGALNAELLIMPGQTETLVWKPKFSGIYPFYCTDFCSALHQEMQGYVRVSPADSKIELKWNKSHKK